MHILLFILFFIIAIIVFGLSIVGFLLRTIFGIGRRSSSSHHGKTGQSQQSYNQGRILRQESTKKYSPKMMVNM